LLCHLSKSEFNQLRHSRCLDQLSSFADESRDLAEGVESAVHQDDIDDVGAAALRKSVLDKEACDALAAAGAS
jgi:hypothetical protein